MLISLIIATYNQVEYIEEIICRLTKIIATLDFDFEIIVVDDGSTDETAKVLKTLSSTYKNVIVIEMSRNYGQQIAFSAGIEVSTGEIVVLSDDDMVLTIDSLQQIIDPIATNDCDICISSIEPVGIIRKTTSKFFWYSMKRITRGSIPKRELTFRAFNRKVALSFIKYKETYRSLTEIMFDLGYRRKYLLLENIEFTNKKSRHKSHSRIKLFLQIILSMRNNTGLGLLYFSCFNFIAFIPASYLLFSIGVITFQNKVAWILASLIWFTWVVVLFIFGLISFTLAQIAREVRQRPLFHYSRTDHVGVKHG